MQVIDQQLAGSNYQHSRINQWSSSVVEQSLNQLTKLGKPFKYIGNVFFSCLLLGCVFANEHLCILCCDQEFVLSCTAQ